MRLLLMTLVLAALSPPYALARERPNLSEEQLARLTIRPVAGKDGLYLLPGFDGSMSGGNVAVLVTDDGVAIVDNKFSYSHGDIVGQVATITDRPVVRVFNTHHHYDHAGSNADFLPTADVLGHANVRVNMSNDARNGETPGLPNLTYEHRTSTFIGGAEVQAHHFGRGHTNGDSVIYFVDHKTVHTGDLFIWGERLDGSTLAPFVDYDYGGSALEWSKTLDGVLSLDFDTVIPGHGPILAREDVEAFRHKMETLVARTQLAVRDGVSEGGLTAVVRPAELGWPLDEGRLRLIYEELSALRPD